MALHGSEQVCAVSLVLYLTLKFWAGVPGVEGWIRLCCKLCICELAQCETLCYQIVSTGIHRVSRHDSELPDWFFVVWTRKTSSLNRCRERMCVVRGSETWNCAVHAAFVAEVETIVECRHVKTGSSKCGFVCPSLGKK